jgi:hypothetical protein
MVAGSWLASEISAAATGAFEICRSERSSGWRFCLILHPIALLCHIDSEIGKNLFCVRQSGRLNRHILIEASCDTD